LTGSTTGVTTPVVIEATGIEKSFQLPTHKVDSLKERLTTFHKRETRALHALRDVSFEVRRGEFFGIVGRNGSGKSTLLKILASIYRADAGTVRMAGRLAPFIELGVGFNPELTARENVELNGVMMGLHRDDARRRLPAVLEFAELEEFVDMKLKNYSSGMMVRLAFSVMIQSDAEILLIDEVLAVGDASFQQKCADVFHEMRDSERTIILVTHDMAAVEHYCNRAMLLQDGAVLATGDPGEVARSYLRLNFEQAPEEGAGADRDRTADIIVLDAYVEDEAGEKATSVEAGRPLCFAVEVEARHDVEQPGFGFGIVNADGVQVAGVNAILPRDVPDRMSAGERARISIEIENPLAPGRYVVRCWIHREHNLGNLILHSPHLFDFVIYGEEISGVIALDYTAKVETE
jgi:ABC-type polysaccharide/polyol phosphate transport system ATPase subunit